MYKECSASSSSTRQTKTSSDSFGGIVDLNNEAGEHCIKVDLFVAAWLPLCANFHFRRAADDGKEFGSKAVDFMRKRLLS